MAAGIASALLSPFLPGAWPHRCSLASQVQTPDVLKLACQNISRPMNPVVLDEEMLDLHSACTYLFM